MSSAPSPLWVPSAARVQQSQLTSFVEDLRARTGEALSDYVALHRFSIDHPEVFWDAMWGFAGLVTHAPYTEVRGPVRMPGTQWFRGARLNFAENLLRRSDDGVALVATDETERDAPVTYAALHDQVGRLQQFLRSRGVGVGDRVVGYLPHRPEAVVAMLAATGLGAIWSSCSPDFGLQGVLDRFGQIAPKVLVTIDGYRYGGKEFARLDQLAAIEEALPSLAAVVQVPLLGEPVSAPRVSWSEALANEGAPHFEPLPPDHPVYILYSSGTTGVPKCIVHGAAGTLVQHAKELMLHSDVRRSDTAFYFTTTGWMMWNWLVSGLLTGARVVLFDGSPGAPDLRVLWRMAERLRVTHFGTSPKYLATLRQQGVRPADHDLEALRVVWSTGAPLAPDQFEWVYEHVKADLQLASIAGGTDIVSCFMGGVPTEPVYAGQIQRPGLGMAVEAWAAPNQPVVGEKGELVCVAPFPSMPVGFYGDDDGARYRKAYFEHYPGVWRHGDFVEITEQGGVIVYGRSDATLNPGGVRIGTAEIYRVVDAMPGIRDSLVVGIPHDGDVRVVLFVATESGAVTSELHAELKHAIREACTPRHVPYRIHAAPDIPRTISGKRVEIAVTRILQGETVANRDALKNPEALDHFETLRPRLFA
ncbi:MAG: acetoacetate--CoA ligase [Myxococcota bacterium]